MFDLKVTAKLNAFNVFVCDQKCNIADIRIHGKYLFLGVGTFVFT